MKNIIFRIAGPLGALLTYSGMSATFTHEQSMSAALLVWMAVWWVSECVNLYITSLLPIVVLPLFGVMKMDAVAPNYMHEVIFLFIGGFLFAYALERWKLHDRIALKIILSIGTTPARVLLGIMLSAYFLSMWINNTATTAMLMPATMAIVGQLDREGKRTGLAAPLLIGLGFSASIGGMATLIGTAPNMIFLKEYTDAFPNGTPVGFAQWMFFGVPVSLVILIGTFFVLRFFHRKALHTEEIDISRCRQDYAALGPMRYEEKWMIFFFAAALLLWFFLVDLRFGEVVIPSWTGALGLPPKMVTESTVAMLVVMVLFFIPSRDKTTTLLTWKEVKKLPVGIIFLFGGGFAISKAVDESQLDMEMASVLSGLSHLSPILLVLILVVFMTLLSEFASNTASLQLVFPVLVAFVGELSVNPLEILVPVTLAASCGFMLPIATPPNTIVFGSERIKSGEMIRSGFFVDLIGIVSITLASFTLIHWVFS